MFQVYFGNKRATKDYEELDEKMKLRVNALCGVLQKVPVPFREYDIRKIEGKDNIYRVRLGDFRIVYYIDELEHKIFIVKLERRSENTYRQ